MSTMTKPKRRKTTRGSPPASSYAHPHCPYCHCPRPHLSDPGDVAIDVGEFIHDEVESIRADVFVRVEDLVRRFRIWCCWTGTVSAAIDEKVLLHTLQAIAPVRVHTRPLGVTSQAYVYGMKLRPVVYPTRDLADAAAAVDRANERKRNAARAARAKARA